MSKKAEARQRVKAMREEQLRKERRRERTLRFGIAGAVLAAVVIIAVAVNASRDGGSANVPSTVSQEENGIVVGQEDAPVTLDTWLDFQCPHCQEYEATNGEAISELVESGDVKVIYHPVNFVNAEISQRGGNAFACAADEGMAGEFVAAAYADMQQWSEDDIIALGENAGIGGDYAQCVRDGTYDDWTADVSASASDADVTGTPTIFIEGPAYDEPQVMEARTPDAIREAVEAAS